MKTENVIVEISFKFALRIVKLYKYLCEEKKEYVLSKQILRSGTSIGANINESQSAESKQDFVHKLGISLKEVRETNYWLKLLNESGYMDKNAFNSIIKDCNELMFMISRIILTSKDNIKDNIKNKNKFE